MMTNLSTQKKPLLIYIVARGHSGSTLLELMLNRDSNIAAMGEIDLFNLQLFRDESTRWIGQCSCGARPAECPRWSVVLQSLENTYGRDLVNQPFSLRMSDVGLEEEFGSKKKFALTRHLFHRSLRYAAYKHRFEFLLDLIPVYRKWVRRRDLVATAYAESANANAVVDASKDPLHMRDLLRYSTLPIKVLFLTRDVRGLAWSAKRNANTPVEESAKEWVQLNSNINTLLKTVNKERWLQVKYEDFCHDSEAELNRIHQFLGFERNALSGDEEFSERHTIAGNAVRFKPIEGVREDLSWQQNLSEHELASIREIAADACKELNYSL